MQRSFAFGVAICAAIGLVGCASTPSPAQVLTPATVAVAAPCLGPEPASPVLQFGVGEYPGDAEAVAAAWADIAALRLYADKLKARAAGCLTAQ